MSETTVIGSLALELNVDPAQLTRQLTSAADTASRQADRQLTSAFSGIGKKIGGILGGLALGAFAKDCLDLGSDLAEVQNVVDTAFKSMSGSVNAFAKDAMKQFGLSETIAKQYMGTIGAMNNAFGFTEKESLDMAEAVTGLTGDVASFYNLDSGEAFTKLKSIWTGETESLKDLGVVMTQTALDQYALNNGFGKTTAKMTEQEKVMLRYQFVTESLSDAVGDFSKTQDSWANQTRVLSLQFDSLKASLGQGFINILTPLIKGLNNLMGKLASVAENFKNFTAAITGNSAATDSLGSVAASASDAAGSVDDITSSAKEAKKTLAGFDKITKLSDDTDSGSDTSGSSSGDGSIAGNTESMAESISKSLGPLDHIKFDNLIKSLNDIKAACEPLKEKLFSGLKWCYDEILLPLAKWTIENVIPAFLQAFAGALNLLNGTLEFLRPIWEWMWENLFRPLAKWTGGIAAGVLWDISDCLAALGKNKNAAAAVAGLTSALAVYKVGKWGNAALEFLDTKLANLSTLGKISLAVGVAFTGYEIGKSLYAMITGDAEEYRLSDLFDSDWEDIKGGLAICVDDFKEGMSVIFDSVGDCVGKIVDYFKECATELYETWIVPVIDNVNECVDEIVNYFRECATELYETWIVPIIDYAKQAWNSIKDTFSAVGSWFKDKFTEARNGIQNAWSSVTGWFVQKKEDILNTFSAVGTWFKDKFTEARNGIENAWTGVSGFFGNVWSGIKQVFGNVTDWFRNTFLDAWKAVKDVFCSGGKIFEGITEGIARNFKNVVNAIIKGINKVVAIPFNKINSMLNDIREISVLGVEPFNGLWSKNPLTVPEIPMLAQGGYVKPNTPQLAMIGDNRHQGEVVAPEDKLTQMAIAAVKAAGGGNHSAEILETLKKILAALDAMDLNISIDGKKLKDIIVSKINEQTRQTGVCEIKI